MCECVDLNDKGPPHDYSYITCRSGEETEKVCVIILEPVSVVAFIPVWPLRKVRRPGEQDELVQEEVEEVEGEVEVEETEE